MTSRNGGSSLKDSFRERLLQLGCEVQWVSGEDGLYEAGVTYDGQQYTIRFAPYGAATTQSILNRRPSLLLQPQEGGRYRQRYGRTADNLLESVLPDLLGIRVEGKGLPIAVVVGGYALLLLLFGTLIVLACT